MKFDFKWFTTLPGIFITVGVVLLIIALIILIVTGKKSKKEKKNIEESGGALQSTPQDMSAQAAPVANPGAVPTTDMMANTMPVSNAPAYDANMNVGPTPIEPVPVENVPASPMVSPMIDSNVGSVAPAVSEVTPSMPTVDSNIISQNVNDIPIPAMPVSGTLNEQNSVSTSFSPLDAIPTNVSSVNNDPFVNTQEPAVTGLAQGPQAITPEPIVQNVITPEPVINSVPNVVQEPVVNSVPNVVQEPVANLEPVVAPVNPIDNASMVSPQINSVNSAPVISSPTVAPVTQNISVAPVAPVTPVVENNSQPGPVIYGGVNPTANLSDVNLNGNQSHQIYGGADPLENTQPIPGVQTVQPVQPVQPVMTAPEMIPNPVQQ